MANVTDTAQSKAAAFRQLLRDTLETEGNIAGGTARLRDQLRRAITACAELCAASPQDYTLAVVLDFLRMGEQRCEPHSMRSWKPFVIMAAHGAGVEDNILNSHADRLHGSEAVLFRAGIAVREARHARGLVQGRDVARPAVRLPPAPPVPPKPAAAPPVPAAAPPVPAAAPPMPAAAPPMPAAATPVPAASSPKTTVRSASAAGSAEASSVAPGRSSAGVSKAAFLSALLAGPRSGGVAQAAAPLALGVASARADGHARAAAPAIPVRPTTARVKRSRSEEPEEAREDAFSSPVFYVASSDEMEMMTEEARLAAECEPTSPPTPPTPPREPRGDSRRAKRCRFCDGDCNDLSARWAARAEASRAGAARSSSD